MTCNNRGISESSRITQCHSIRESFFLPYSILNTVYSSLSRTICMTVTVVVVEFQARDIIIFRDRHYTAPCVAYNKHNIMYLHITTNNYNNNYNNNNNM